MENNSDRMGFALIALSVVAFVLLAVNGPLKSTVDGFFNGFKDWQTQTFNDISETNKQDVTHTAYSWSADGTDRFTTTKPNLNLLTDSKVYSNKDNTGKTQTTSIVAVNGKKLIDDSGDTYLEFITDGTNTNTYTKDWFRAYLIGDPGSTNFTNINVTPSTVYTFSAYMRGTGQHILYAYNSWTSSPSTGALRFNLTSNWTLYTFTVTSNKTIDFSRTAQFFIRSEFASTIDVKKPKVELGSNATPYMPSASEVKPSDQPKYIGTYTDKNESASQDPSKYTWKLNPEYHE